MKPLTLQIAPRQDGKAGFDAVLREGTPEDNGAELERVSNEELTAQQQAELVTIRSALLQQTGKIPNLEARAEGLGRLLFPGAIKTRWRALLDASGAELVTWSRDRQAILDDEQSTAEQKAWASTRPGYRTYLQIAVPALEQVPWELARLDGEPLFLLSDNPISRYRVVGARSPWTPGWQIRILVVIASLDAAIQADAELREIRSELRRLDRIYDIDVIRAPSRETLTRHLRDFKPHVLHFIGHGAGDHLQIHDAGAGVNEPWGAAQIATDIGPMNWVPEVVYLNACRSQGAAAAVPATDADQERQRTIVDALLGRHVLAVVAMQADIRGSAAGACVAAFYGALLDGSPIDVACASGRARVSRLPGRDGSRDAYLPVLTLTVPADRVLRHKTTVEAPILPPPLADRLFGFVDRYQERRSIVEAFEARSRKNVIVVRGQQDIGKSWLLCWSADLCLRRQYPVRYVELGACTDWLDVLRSLARGNPKLPGIGDPLGTLLGPSFNWKLAHLANGVVQPQGAPAAVEPDTAPTLTEIEKHGKRPPNFGALVGAAFHEALTVTRDRPLVILFDQMEAGDRGFASDQFALLRANWLDLMVAAGDGRVRVLLAIRSEREQDYQLHIMPATYGSATLQQFEKQDSHELIRELFQLRLARTPAANRPTDAEMRERFEEFLAKQDEEAISGRELQEWVDALWTLSKKRVRP